MLLFDDSTDIWSQKYDLEIELVGAQDQVEPKSRKTLKRLWPATFLWQKKVTFANDLAHMIRIDWDILMPQQFYSKAANLS